MSREPTEESFLKDVREHQMQVLRDDGEYRHVRFSKPGTYCMSFDLITWPGYLAYSGDMGCYVFSRIRDMFEFFRTSPQWLPKGGLHINLSYWAEKCTASDRSDGIKRYSEDKFRENVAHWLDSREACDEVRAEVEQQVLCAADDGEHAAMTAVMDFEHEGFRFNDFWEADNTAYTYRYIWCCYALAWGIRQYDTAKAPVS